MSFYHILHFSVPRYFEEMLTGKHKCWIEAGRSRKQLRLLCSKQETYNRLHQNIFSVHLRELQENYLQRNNHGFSDGQPETYERKQWDKSEGQSILVQWPLSHWGFKKCEYTWRIHSFPESWNYHGSIIFFFWNKLVYVRVLQDLNNWTIFEFFENQCYVLL